MACFFFLFLSFFFPLEDLPSFKISPPTQGKFIIFLKTLFIHLLLLGVFFGNNLSFLRFHLLRSIMFVAFIISNWLQSEALTFYFIDLQHFKPMQLLSSWTFIIIILLSHIRRGFQRKSQASPKVHITKYPLTQNLIRILNLVSQGMFPKKHIF